MNVKSLIQILVILCSTKTAFTQVIDAAMCTEDAHPFINKYIKANKSVHIIPFDSLIANEEKFEFKPVGDEPVIYHGYDPFYYWYKFEIENGEDMENRLVFLTGSLGIRHAELFQKTDSIWKSLGVLGYSYRFQTRPYLHSKYAYPITVPAKSHNEFYLFVNESHAYKTYAFGLFHEKAMKNSANKFYFSFGIMIGLLLLFLIFNAYLFIHNGGKIHFWYAVYILAQVFLLVKHEGLDAEFLGMDSVFGYRSTSMAAVSGFSIGLLMHVLLLFFDQVDKKSLPFIIVRAIKWALLTISLVQLVTFYVQPVHDIEWAIVRISTNTTFFGMVTILLYCIYCIYIGFRQSGWFILVALSVFLFGGIERILFLTSKTHLLPPSLFEIGMVLETIIISFGLMYRYQLAEKERVRIAEELNNQKLHLAREIIGAQENERKRIAQDLHDDLGSNLAAIKIHMESFQSPQSGKDEIINLLDRASSNIRHVSHNLMPPEFSNTSLKHIIKAHTNQLNEDSAIQFKFIDHGDLGCFNKEEELMIYRIIIELTTNIIKHAEASEVFIQLLNHENVFQIIVEDDGVGMSSEINEGIGLKNIKTRTDYLKGSINTDTNEQGTTIIISIPINPNRNETTN